MNITDNPNYYFTDKPYKPKLICCECRKVFKRRLLIDIKVEKGEDWSNMICPNCGKKASYIGPKFRAPKSDNIKAWKSIEILNNIGVLKFIGFASNKIEIPESYKGLENLLTEIKTNYEKTIERWMRLEYNEENKLQIKTFSDIISQVDKYLNK